MQYLNNHFIHTLISNSFYWIFSGSWNPFICFFWYFLLLTGTSCFTTIMKIRNFLSTNSKYIQHVAVLHITHKVQRLGHLCIVFVYIIHDYWWFQVPPDESDTIVKQRWKHVLKYCKMLSLPLQWIQPISFYKIRGFSPQICSEL